MKELIKELTSKLKALGHESINYSYDTRTGILTSHVPELNDLISGVISAIGFNGHAVIEGMIDHDNVYVTVYELQHHQVNHNYQYSSEGEVVPLGTYDLLGTDDEALSQRTIQLVESVDDQGLATIGTYEYVKVNEHIARLTNG